MKTRTSQSHQLGKGGGQAWQDQKNLLVLIPDFPLPAEKNGKEGKED